MKCTLKNLDKVIEYIQERHVDNQYGADFAQFDDETDLVTAIENTVEHLIEQEELT